MRGDIKIISGRGHKVTVHYVAPPSDQLIAEIQQFLEWFSNTSSQKNFDGLLRAAVAHLWFEKIHPYDDGNGRIGRAIIDMALAQDEQLNTRFYSVSAAIMEDRKGYYDVLDEVSKYRIDITPWLVWFLQCYKSAIELALQNIHIALLKAQFWRAHEQSQFNERQKKVLNKMLDKGPYGFIGGMTTRNYVSLTKTSRATAYR